MILVPIVVSLVAGIPGDNVIIWDLKKGVETNLGKNYWTIGGPRFSPDSHTLALLPGDRTPTYEGVIIADLNTDNEKRLQMGYHWVHETDF